MNQQRMQHPENSDFYSENNIHAAQILPSVRTRGVPHAGPSLRTRDVPQIRQSVRTRDNITCGICNNGAAEYSSFRQNKKTSCGMSVSTVKSSAAAVNPKRMSGSAEKPPVPPKNPKKKDTSRRKHRSRAFYAVNFTFIILVTVLTALLCAYLISYEPDTDGCYGDENVIPVQNGGGSGNADSMRYKRREGVYNFLVAGLDAEGGRHTDVIMLINYDVKNGKIAVMNIPRDTYINIGRNFKTINCMYTGEYNRHAGEEKDAAKLDSMCMESLKQLVERGLSVKIDYWASVDIAGFRDIVDLIGGVDITLPDDLDYEDPYQELYIHLKAGRQTLDGKHAEQFVRFRDSYASADKGRIDAQKMFIAAFMDSVQNSLTADRLPALINSAMKSIRTSISIPDCVFFARRALKMDMKNVSMMTLAGEGVYDPDAGTWREIICRNAALESVNEYFNVYEEPVADEEFDPDFIFVDTSSPALCEVYYKDTVKNRIDSASDIEQNGLHIPKKQ